MRMAKRAVVVAACLFAVLDLAFVSGPALAYNLQFVLLLRAMPSLRALATFWYGTGLRPFDGSQARAIGVTYYPAVLDANPCSAWEKSALDAWPFGALTPPQETTAVDEVLIEARRRECDGRPSEALEILSAAPPSTRIRAEQARLLRRLGKDSSAFPLALALICPDHPEWCEGYLKSQWYDPPSESTVPLLLDSAVNVIRVPATVPPIVSGTTLGQNSYTGNYLGFTSFPADSLPPRIRIKGEIVGGSTSGCISARLIFLNASGDWLGEVKQPYSVSGQFQVEFSGTVPANTATVWPQLTFDAECFDAGQKIVIYHVSHVQPQ